MARVDKAVRLINLFDPVFIRSCLHQILDRGKILFYLIGGQNALNLAKPEIEILHCSDEGPLPVGLLQFPRLLAGFLREPFPPFSDGLKPVLLGLLTSRAFLSFNEVLTPGKHALDPVSIGSQFSFKCLVLLVFGLDVGRILVVLLLVANCCVKVFMLHDHSLIIVFLAVALISLEEGFPGCHPVFSPFVVTVIELKLQTLVELKLQTLVELHPPCNPGLSQVLACLAHFLQLLLHLGGGKVICLEQLLSKELRSLEGSRPCINLSAMLLVTLKQGFDTSGVSGKLVDADETLHAAHP